MYMLRILCNFENTKYKSTEMLVSTYYQAMLENLLNCGIKIMKYGAKNGDQGNKMKGYKEMCLLSEHAH